jgi:hypothetical protein
MELCGVPVKFKTDGNSLVPLLRDDDNPQCKDAAWAYYNEGITVRTPTYRLTKYFRNEQPVIELFDHSADDLENTNVAAKHPDAVRELLLLLEEKDFGIYQKKDGR